MPEARYYDPQNREITEPKMILVDRLALGAWLLTGGLIGMVYFLWGDPGTFRMFETVASIIIAMAWFAGRVIDFMVTGRIRYGTE